MKQSIATSIITIVILSFLTGCSVSYFEPLITRVAPSGQPAGYVEFVGVPLIKNKDGSWILKTQIDTANPYYIFTTSLNELQSNQEWEKVGEFKWRIPFGRGQSRQRLIVTPGMHTFKLVAPSKAGHSQESMQVQTQVGKDEIVFVEVRYHELRYEFFLEKIEWEAQIEMSPADAALPLRSPNAVEQLVAIYKQSESSADKGWFDRWLIAYALGHTGDSKAISHLQEIAARDPSTMVRQIAIEAINSLTK